MYENFKTKVALKELSQKLRQNIYWGHFPDKEAFNSETLGEHISAEQLPNFLQTLDVCAEGTTLSFTKTTTNVKGVNWKTTDCYYVIEVDFATIENLLKKAIESQNAEEMMNGLQRLLNQEVSLVLWPK